MTLVADRFERRLGEECGKLREEFRALGVELRSDLKVEVANARADLLNWSFLSGSDKSPPSQGSRRSFDSVANASMRSRQPVIDVR